MGWQTVAKVHLPAPAETPPSKTGNLAPKALQGLAKRRGRQVQLLSGCAKATFLNRSGRIASCRDWTLLFEANILDLWLVDKYLGNVTSRAASYPGTAETEEWRSRPEASRPPSRGARPPSGNSLGSAKRSGSASSLRKEGADGPGQSDWQGWDVKETKAKAEDDDWGKW